MKITKNKIKNNLAYYVFALLVTILFFILWQGFREKPIATPQIKKNPFESPKISGPKVDLNQKIFFASNGKDTAYKIKKGEKWTVIFKGVESNEYDFVSNAIFSSDGSQFAFAAENSGQAYVVVNNTQEISSYRGVGFITFNSNGSTIAFVAAKSSNSYVIISVSVSSQTTTTQTEETESFEQIGTVTDSDGDIVSIIFSPNGEEMIYITQNSDGTVSIVEDGEVIASYDSVENLILNDDGTLTYTAQNNGEEIQVVEDNIIQEDPISNDGDDSDSQETSSETQETSSTGYKYKIITDKDIDRSTEGSVDVSTSCVEGQNCNF